MAPILTAFLMVVFVPIETPVEFTDADLLNATKLDKKLWTFDFVGQQEQKFNAATKRIVDIVERNWRDNQESFPMSGRRRPVPLSSQSRSLCGSTACSIEVICLTKPHSRS